MYETVTAEEGPFIKVMNVGERIEVNRIEGELINCDQRRRADDRILANQMLFLLDEHPYQTSDDLLCEGKSSVFSCGGYADDSLDNR